LTKYHAKSSQIPRKSNTRSPNSINISLVACTIRTKFSVLGHASKVGREKQRACLVRGESYKDHDGGEGEEPEDEFHRHG
jgi:hypothetical protein